MNKIYRFLVLNMSYRCIHILSSNNINKLWQSSGVLIKQWASNQFGQVFHLEYKLFFVNIASIHGKQFYAIRIILNSKHIKVNKLKLNTWVLLTLLATTFFNTVGHRGGVDSTPPPLNFSEVSEASSFLHGGRWIYKAPGSKILASQLKNSGFESQMEKKSRSRKLRFPLKILQKYKGNFEQIF